MMDDGCLSICLYVCVYVCMYTQNEQARKYMK